MERKSNKKKLVKRRRSNSTSFSSAFRAAKQKGLKEFTWNGKRYNTQEKDNGTYKGVQYVDNRPRVREYNGTTIGNDGKYYHEKGLTLEQRIDNLVAMNAFGLNFKNINPNVNPSSLAFNFIDTHPELAEYYGLDDVWTNAPKRSKNTNTRKNPSTSQRSVWPQVPNVIISSVPLSQPGALTDYNTYYDFSYPQYPL